MNTVPSWKACTCQSHENNVAIITRAFYDNPDQAKIDFVVAHAGKLVCFKCGGEVQAAPDIWPDHVTATCVTARLRELGVI